MRIRIEVTLDSDGTMVIEGDGIAADDLRDVLTALSQIGERYEEGEEVEEEE